MSEDNIISVCLTIVMVVFILCMTQCSINNDNRAYDIEALKIERGIKP